jgi:hypothetical protein
LKGIGASRWLSVRNLCRMHGQQNIKLNMEIDKLIEGADIVKFIKAQRIKWLGHI